MIIRLADGRTLTISDERGEVLKQQIISGVAYVDIDDELIRTSVITSLTPSTKVAMPKTPALPSSTLELTDEQRQKNIDRIRQMKKEFFNKRNAA